MSVAVTPLRHAWPRQRGSSTWRLPGTLSASPRAGSPSIATAARCATTAACDDCVVSFLLGPRARGRGRHRRRRGACHADARPRRPRARPCASAPGPASAVRARPRGAGHRSGRRPVRRHLLVTNDFPPKVGGIQSYLWELWQRLDPDTLRGADRVARTPAPPPSTPQQAERGVHIERVPEPTLYFPTPGRAAPPCAGAPREHERRPGAARPRPPARPARARSSACPTASSCTAPRSPCPAGCPGHPRGAGARAARRGARRLGRRLPGGGGAGAPRRT